MSGEFASAIYHGHVRHRRHAPHAHAFTYPVAYLYLDLDEVDAVMALSPFWSSRRRNLAEFRRSDYHGDPAKPLIEAVRDTVAEHTGRRPMCSATVSRTASMSGFAGSPW